MPKVIDRREPDYVALALSVWKGKGIVYRRFYDNDKKFAWISRKIKKRFLWLFSRTQIVELGNLGRTGDDCYAFSTHFAEGEHFEFIKEIMTDLENYFKKPVLISIRDD